MRVGWVGLGKLGLPCALACESKGHEVCGIDPDPGVARILATRSLPYMEEGAAALLASTRLELVTMADLVDWAEVILVAVQTPHGREFEGVLPMPEKSSDFDYGYLVEACRQVSEADRTGRRATIAVVSTVLPGTLRREIAPLLNGGGRLVYNPQFIAMGTTVADFLEPEFVLLGSDHARSGDEHLERMNAFYATITDAPKAVMSIESAELTKVAYNVFVGMKIAFANYLGEYAQAIGAHVDDVTDSLAKATRRVVSGAYMRAGMGDGGGCHPRDLIALSWASERYGLSYDLPRRIMNARESQTRRLAILVSKTACEAGLPVVILGKAYKPGTNLTVGSPAVLLANLLDSRVEVTSVDPYLDATWDADITATPAVFVVATDHVQFHEARYPRGSVVIDPWGHTKVPDGVMLHTPGRCRHGLEGQLRP